MLSDKKRIEAILEFYQEIYKVSVPSVDFLAMRDTCINYIDNNTHEKFTTDTPLTTDECIQRNCARALNFYAYWTSSKKYEEIVARIIKKYKIKGYEVNGFNMHAYLGCGPTISCKRWLEQHPEYTYEQFRQMALDAGYSEDEIPPKESK